MNTTIPQLRSRTWVALAAVVAVAAGIGWFVADRGDALPDGAVFRIDGEVVTEDELDDRLAVLEALYGVERPQGEQEDEFQRDAAKSMAVSMILDRAAEELEVDVPDQQVEAALSRAIEVQATGRSGFVEFLAQSGLSEEDVLEEIRLQIATSRLVEKVTEDVAAVQPDEVRAFYDENRADMVSPEKRTLRNIVVSSRVDAQRVLREARRGTSFASLAATWSRDASTRDQGGLLGTLAAADLDPAYAEAAFTARDGAVFGPVQTQHGWNVGLVASVVPSQRLAFADIEQRLTEDLQAKRLLDTWREWLGDELRDAGVEYADDYRPEDPDAPPAELPE